MKTKIFTNLLAIIIMISLSTKNKAQVFQPDSVYLVSSNFPEYVVYGRYWEASLWYADTIVNPNTDTIINPDFVYALPCVSFFKDTSYIFNNKYYVKYVLSGYIINCFYLEYVNLFYLRACNGAGHCSAVDTFVLNVLEMDPQYLPYLKPDAPLEPFTRQYLGGTLQSLRFPLNDYFANPLKRSYADTLWVDSLVYGTMQVLHHDTLWVDTTVVLVDTVQVPIAWQDSTIQIPHTVWVPIAWGDSIIAVLDSIPVPIAWGDTIMLVCDTLQGMNGDSVVCHNDTLYNVPLAWADSLFYRNDTIQVPIAWQDSIYYQYQIIQVPIAWGDSLVYRDSTYQVPRDTLYYTTEIDSSNVLDTIVVQHLYYPPLPLEYRLMIHLSPSPPYGSMFTIVNDTLCAYLNEIYMPDPHYMIIPILVSNDSSGVVYRASINYWQNQAAYLQGAYFQSVASPGEQWWSQFTIGDTIWSDNDTLGLINNFIIPDWVTVDDTAYIVDPPNKDLLEKPVYVKIVTMTGIVPYDKVRTYDFILSWCDWAGVCTPPVVYTLEVLTTETTERMQTESGRILYPNPAREAINLRSEKGAIIEVMNVQGAILKRESATTEVMRINISDLPSGMYILREQSNRGVRVEKFVKE